MSESPFLLAMHALAHLAKKANTRDLPSVVITFASSEDAEAFKSAVIASIPPLMLCYPPDVAKGLADDGRGKAHGIKFRIRNVDEAATVG